MPFQTVRGFVDLISEAVHSFLFFLLNQLIVISAQRIATIGKGLWSRERV